MDKKQVSFRLERETIKKLKFLAVEQERSLTDLYVEAIQDLLYKYQKEGSGHLVKCYKEKIVKDFTDGKLKCPQCEVTFARKAMIHGKPANKIIQGKVFTKR